MSDLIERKFHQKKDMLKWMEVADLGPDVVVGGEVNTGSLIKTEFFWKLGDNKWSTIQSLENKS